MRASAAAAAALSQGGAHARNTHALAEGGKTGRPAHAQRRPHPPAAGAAAPAPAPAPPPRPPPRPPPPLLLLPLPPLLRRFAARPPARLWPRRYPPPAAPEPAARRPCETPAARAARSDPRPGQACEDVSGLCMPW